MTFLKVAHLNIRTLLGHFQEFKDMLLTNNFDVFGISETRLDDSIPSSTLHIDGYRFIREDRCRSGGGVGVYIRASLKFTRFTMSSDLEQIWIKLDSKRSCFALGILYKPPCYNYKQFYSLFEDAVAYVYPAVDNILCLGDFNVDMLRTESSECRFVTVTLEGLGLFQIVDKPTRVTDESETLLDHILTTDCDFASNSSVLSVSREVSDHCLTYCCVKFFNLKPAPVFKTVRDFKNIDHVHFRADLLSIPWNNIYHMDDVNRKVQFLNDGIIALLNLHAPYKTYRITKKYAPWLTGTLREMMLLRDNALKLYKFTRGAADWQAYKDLRNIVTVAVKREKKAYYNHTLNNAHTSKSTWRLLKSLNFSKSASNVIPDNLADVNLINDYFVDSVPKLLPSDSLFSFYKSHLINSLSSSFTFGEVSELDVLKIISDIKSKAVGCDGINILTIKLCIFHLLPHITHVMNYCLANSVFPETWKQALIIPLLKTSEPQHLADLRPISILPTFSKILEKIMTTQIRNHLENNQIIPNLQSGFRPRHSCCTSLLNITDDILASTDQGRLTILVALDYSKAFDTINHGLLESILHFVGCSGSASDMLANYLTGRGQRVVYSGKVSTCRKISRGVPQGSILGPLLFSIYISNISRAISSQLHFYADDSQLLLSFPVDEAPQAITALNYDLANMYDISVQHCLQLNTNKSAAVLFGRKNDRAVFLSRGHHLNLGGSVIPFKTCLKNLGLLLDHDLRFTDHISRCLQKAYLNLRLIYSQRSLLDRKTKIMLCESLVLSHLNFCDVVYDPCLLSTDIYRIQKLQNSCLRLIFGIRKFDHISHTFKEVNWLSMRQRRYLHSATLFFKILLSKTPPYLFKKVSYRCDIHNLNIRFKGTLTPPRHSTEIFKRSFSYNITKVVNGMPVNTAGLSLSRIKHELYNHLIIGLG